MGDASLAHLVDRKVNAPESWNREESGSEAPEEARNPIGFYDLGQH